MKPAAHRSLSLFALATCTALVLGDSPGAQPLCAAYGAVDVTFDYSTDCPGGTPSGRVHWSLPGTPASAYLGDRDLIAALEDQARRGGLFVGITLVWDTSACPVSGGECSHTDPAGTAVVAGLSLGWTRLGRGTCSPWQGGLTSDQVLRCPADVGRDLAAGDEDAGPRADAAAPADASAPVADAAVAVRDSGTPDMAAPGQGCTITLTRVP